ncbi:hypothetical protein FRZ61_42100 [Hypericibacter adhaerens]|uniref:Uncharacterized protein n=1 Tax=Hypericibacter adhaerens TaxID=2602016 RepID=A0A5J6N3B8_9PROT|nr:hypothetical protein [Hypericibacter adhaerens]QEX24269.1 hypothetical protein FRZ61_42100 [Hypericibacter adhaerens]
MFSLRTHAIISGALFAAMILFAIGGNIVTGGRPLKDPTLMLGAKILIFGLFLAFGFSVIPLLLKIFLAGQGAIGNSEVGLVKTLAAHQTAVVWVIWGIFIAGLALAIPAAINDDFFGPEAARSLRALLRGGSKGVLVAAPGMTTEEIVRQSSLKVNVLENPSGPGTPIADGVVFDFQIPGGAITLKGCRYYFISFDSNDRAHVQGISIGTSPDKMSVAEIDALDEDLRARLEADGWRAGHEVYKDEQDRQLHGGATQGPDGYTWLKGDTILDIERKRMDDPVPGEDAATAGQWIQFIELWARQTYPYIERYEFAPPSP